MACFSSGPSTVTSSLHPSSAANVMTPMILLALIEKPSLFRKISDLYFAASFTREAAGLVCKPALFLTVTVDTNIRCRVEILADTAPKKEPAQAGIDFKIYKFSFRECTEICQQFVHNVTEWINLVQVSN